MDWFFGGVNLDLFASIYYMDEDTDMEIQSGTLGGCALSLS